MKPIIPFHRLFTFGMALLFILPLVHCTKEDNEEASLAELAALPDYTGTYSGSYALVQRRKSDNSLIDSISTTYAGNISGSYPNYVFAKRTDQSSSISLSVQGNAFVGSNGTGEFFENNYSGSLIEDRLRMNGTGENDTATWSKHFNMIKVTGLVIPGGNANRVTIDGQFVGMEQYAFCGNNFTAAFAARQDSLWVVNILFQTTCSDNAKFTGAYNVVPRNSIDNSSVSVVLQKTRAGNLIDSYEVLVPNGNFDYSLVDGKKAITGSGIDVVNGQDTLRIGFGLVEY